MASASKLSYIAVPVECPHCQTKQVVHVLARSGLVQMDYQTISCKKCDEALSVMVQEAIIDGPFLQ
jgi:hypothetical protein